MRSETLLFVTNYFGEISLSDVQSGQCFYRLANYLSEGIRRAGFTKIDTLEEASCCLLTICEANILYSINCSGSLGLDYSREYFEEGELDLTWSISMAIDGSREASGESLKAAEINFLNIWSAVKNLVYENQDICMVKQLW